jgi:hypothetical protein
MGGVIIVRGAGLAGCAIQGNIDFPRLGKRGQSGDEAQAAGEKGSASYTCCLQEAPPRFP